MKAIKDAVIVLGGQSASYAISFAASILAARLLGTEGKGILVSLLLIPTILISIGELGIRQALVYNLGRKNYDKNALISTSYILSCLIALPLSLIALLIYAFYYKNEFGYLLQFLAISGIPIALFTKVSSGIFLGSGRIGVFNKVGWIPNSVNLIGIFVLIGLFKWGIVGAALSSLLGNLIILFYGLNIIIRETSIRFSLFSWKISQRLLAKGFLFALSLFIIQLNYKIDIFFLKYFLPFSEIGLYSVGVNLAEILWQIPSAIGVVILSRTAIGNDANQKYTIAKALRLSLLLMTLVAVISIIIMPYFIPLVYGTEFKESINVNRILMIGVVIFTFFKILNSRIAGLGKPHLTIVIFIPCLLFKILANLLLVPLYGIEGAAWASNISYILGSILMLLTFSKIDGIKIKEIFRFSLGDWSEIIQIIRKNVNKNRFRSRRI